MTRKRSERTRKDPGRIKSGLRKPRIKCECCGNRHKLNRHHIVPREYYKSDNWDNIAIVCLDCHRIAHDIIKIISPKNPAEFKRVLELTKLEISRIDGIMERLGIPERRMLPVDKKLIMSINDGMRLYLVKSER